MKVPTFEEYFKIYRNDIENLLEKNNTAFSVINNEIKLSITKNGEVVFDYYLLYLYLQEKGYNIDTSGVIYKTFTRYELYDETTFKIPLLNLEKSSDIVSKNNFKMTECYFSDGITHY